MLRYKEMCHGNLLVFHKKSLDMGSILARRNSFDMGPIFMKIKKKRKKEKKKKKNR